MQRWLHLTYFDGCGRQGHRAFSLGRVGGDGISDVPCECGEFVCYFGKAMEWC